MDRDQILILLLLGVFILMLRGYVDDTHDFFVVENMHSTVSPRVSSVSESSPIVVIRQESSPIPPSISPSPAPSPKLSSTTPSSAKVMIDVPFASQAPFGDWKDQRQQDGCEEASVIMAIHWARSIELRLDNVLQEIHELSAFGEKTFGTFHDTSIGDTFKFFSEHYQFHNVELVYDIVLNDIKAALNKGRIVIVPVDGRLLNNPHFTPPGPNHHMLVIKGYDEAGKYFITNEPGTRYGESYRYGYSVMQKAIRDYPTGSHEPLPGIRTAMITVGKN